MRERMIDVDEATLWVAEQGAGLPLVLCNGGPGCRDYLGPVAAMVDDIARVYRFEPRGCGRSSAGGPYDIETGLADLEALRIAFQHERWVVGGHSAGADLALAYGLTFPERTRALLLLASGGVQNDRQWHAAYEARRDTRGEILPADAFPHNPEVNRAVMASWRRFIKEPTLLRRIADLYVPTLIVHGTEDIRPDWPARQIADLLPNGAFISIDGGQHHLELTHPDGLRHHLRVFLEALVSDGGGQGKGVA